MENPTIVAGYLSDEELKKSVDALVKYVAESTGNMAKAFDKSIESMNTKLQELGSRKKSPSGGTEEAGINMAKSMRNVKKEAEDLNATYDKIVGALQMAVRQTHAFQDINSKRTPSTEEYRQYEEALSRIVSLNGKLNEIRAKMSLNAVQKGQFAPDMKEYTDSLVRTSDTLKKMSAYYKELERSSQKTGQAATHDTATYDLLAQKLRQAAEQANKRYGVNDEVLNLRANLHEVEAQLKKTNAEWAKFNPFVRDKESFESEMNRIKASLDRVVEARSKLVGKPLFEVQRMAMGEEVTKLREEMEALVKERQKFLLFEDREKKLKDEYADITRRINEMGQAMVDAEQKEAALAGGTQRYTEEVRKQAQAIRESEQWRKNGYYTYEEDGTTYVINAKEKLSIEDQIVKRKQQAARFSEIQKENEDAIAHQNQESAETTEQQLKTEKKLSEAEEAYLASKKTEAQLMEESKQRLQETQLLYEDIKRNQDNSKGLSAKWQLDTTTESIQTLNEAYRNLSEKERRTPFGKELKRYISELEGELDGLKFRLQDEVLMSADLSSSYNLLANKLQRLQGIYNNMNATERDSERGRMVIESLQKTSRELDEIRRKAKTPINLESVLNFKPHTLNEIAVKMQALNTYLREMKIDDAKSEETKKRIRDITNELENLKKKQEEVMGTQKNFVTESNTFTRAISYIKNRLAFYMTVGASVNFVKQIIEIRGQYETLERSLGTLIGSAERGTQVFQEMQKMALVSPFTTVQLAEAAKQMIAYDVAASDVVDVTRRLGDVAAAVGQPIDRLTYSLGQISSYGYLTSINAKMFTRSGIPVIKQLAEYYSEVEQRVVSTADVMDRVKKHMVSYNDVMQVMYRMTDEGGRFFDYQAKMADTLRIQLANLTLAWQNMLNDIGDSNQSLISVPIKLLKELFKSWREIDKALTTVAATYGVTLITAMLGVTKAMLGQQAIINALKLAWVKLAAVVKNLIANWETAVIAIAFTAIATSVYEMIEAGKAINEFNSTLSEHAKESADSISKFVNANDKMTARLKAQSGALQRSEAEKVWESIREEIETSSAASDIFINKLQGIADMNERVSTAFNMVDKIRETNELLSELQDKLTYTSDKWGGFLGEGIAEDLEDLSETIEHFGGYRMEKLRTAQGEYFDSLFTAIKSDLDEAEREVDNFSKHAIALLTTELGDGVSDPVMVQEAVKRIIKEFEAKNTQIQGAGKDFFEAFFAQQAAAAFPAFDQLEFQYTRLLDKIYRDANSTFGNVSDEILEVGKDLSDKQNEAIDKALQGLRDSLPPEMKGIIDSLQAEIDNNPLEFKIKILGKFGKEIRDEWQKDFDTAIKGKGYGVLLANEYQRSAGVYADTRKKADEDIAQYEKRLQDLEEETKTKIDATNRSLAKRMTLGVGDEDPLLQRLKEDKKEFEDLRDVINETQERYGFLDKETKKGSGSKKDVLGDALSKEVQIISDMQKRYKEYRKMGFDSQEAITKATEEYGKTLNATNRTLEKFGIMTLKSSQLTAMPLREIRDFYQKQLGIAERLDNVKGMDALEKAIANINVEITKIDYKKITDGLNNELGKLKDEYELAVELDADPELGNVISELFDIDTAQLPQSIDEYAEKIVDKMNRAFEEEKKDFRLPTIDLTQDDLKAYREESLKEQGKISEDEYNLIKKTADEIKSLRKKDAEDTFKQTQELQYKLADVNGKIAIEQKKLANLEAQLARETREDKRRLLELQIQDQKNAIAKLGEDVLQMMDTYKALYSSIAEHSAVVTRRIANQWKQALESAQKTPDGKWTITDPRSGQKATISAEKYGRELDKVNGKLRESASVFKKIREALTKGEDNELDFVKGLELIGQEAQKAAGMLREVSGVITSIGGDDDSVENLNNMASTLEGIGTTMQGYAQMKNGDALGGISNVVKGVGQVISSWFDDSNKEIDRQVKESERSVKRLEYAYLDLEQAIDRAYGTAVIGAKQAAFANKELQMAELERQLHLEQSRKKKNQDEDKIQDLKTSIRELQIELTDSVRDITDDLLGTSVGDFAENLVSSMIESFKQGEDYMKVFEDSFDKMIDNIIMKSIVSRVAAQYLDAMWESIEDSIQMRSQKEAEAYAQAQARAAQVKNMTDKEVKEQMMKEYGTTDWVAKRFAGKVISDDDVLEYRKAVAEYEKSAKAALDAQSAFTDADIDNLMQQVTSIMPELGEKLKEIIGRYYTFGQDTETQLSALKQGLMGVTEDTAGALEAITNGISQQCYLQSDILIQIRDTVQSFDIDIQTASLSQILLQLQSSYQLQQSMLLTMENWTNPSGNAVRVELIS